MQLCFLISALSGSEKIKRDLLSGWTTQLWFIFKLIRVKQAQQRTVKGPTDHNNSKLNWLKRNTSSWILVEDRPKLNWEKQTAWKYCMNISIFIGSLVALFGIFGIAVFWYKIMTEYNERRGIVFIDTFYSLKIIETKTWFFLHFIDNIIYMNLLKNNSTFGSSSWRGTINVLTRPWFDLLFTSINRVVTK